MHLHRNFFTACPCQPPTLTAAVTGTIWHIIKLVSLPHWHSSRLSQCCECGFKHLPFYFCSFMFTLIFQVNFGTCERYWIGSLFYFLFVLLCCFILGLSTAQAVIRMGYTTLTNKCALTLPWLEITSGTERVVRSPSSFNPWLVRQDCQVVVFVVTHVVFQLTWDDKLMSHRSANGW